MIRYSNRGGGSGVHSYDIGADYIQVKFNGNSKVYTYSYYGGAGSIHVEKMKRLAENGSGLNGYINSYVKNNYDR